MTVNWFPLASQSIHILISPLQNNLEEPEWDSENKDKLEGDSEAEGEKDDKEIRSSKRAGNQ